VTAATITTYLPITNNSSSITIGTISVTSSANTYTVAIPYSYTTITTTSGVNFNVSTTVFNYYNNTSGTSTVRNLKILDLGNIPLSSSGNQFKNLTTLTSFASGSQSTATSLTSMFYGCTGLTQVTFDASFNTTNTTTMDNMFNGCNKLQSLNLSNWNTKKVTTMASMFQNDASLNSISFGVNFDASSCTTMASMFSGCSSMTAIDLGYCTTPSVTTMNSMFNNCSSLTSVNISNFTTNNVTNMDSMFKLCGKMQSLNLINWNTKKVTTMANMFYYDFSLNSITFGGNFDASSCTTMANMFYNCSSLTAIDLSNCTTPLVTSMSAMFGGCNSLTSLDISKFTTNNVTNMYAVFYQCNKLPSLNLSNWNTKKATTMGSMFHEDFSLNSITFSANFDASSCTTMASMFYGCSSLTAIDLSYCTTPSVTSMGSMFYNCSSLSSLNITNFATNNVTNMYAMFGGCSSLSSLNISNFNTNNVPNMAGMFGGCSSLTSLNVSNFTTPNVSDTQYMFYGCSNLSSLNISNFTTSNVTNMASMFYGCSKLPSLSLANWNTTNVTNMTNMFNTTPLLTTIGDVYTNWNVTNVGTNHANFALNSGLKVMPNFVDSPTITSAATASVSENISTSTTVYTVIATDPDANTTFIYSICGGDDSALFTIDASNGIVRFNGSPNFDAPTDANGDNVYNIIVAVSDGANIATKAVAISVTNANDSASITGTSVGSITESDVAQSVSGSLRVSDEDAGEAFFVPQTDASGNNEYGSFSIDASGNWSYTMNSANNQFVAGQTYADSITVVSVDGTATQVITVTMTGTNDAAVISGTSVGSISETNAAQSVSGSLRVSDADAGQSSFVAQTNVSGNNCYGSFSINASGAWSYTMSTAHNEFVAGQTYADSITVSSYDGSANQVITVTMTGTNNAAVISGTSVGSITESDIIQSVSGSLRVSDADAGEAFFVPQTDIAGNNGYGSFSIDASGNWTYTMSTAHNEFVAGQLYTDSITVVSVDGSATQDIIVTITGTNNIPTIGGQNTGSIIQSNEVQSVSGSLSVLDADAGESSFVAQTNVAGNGEYGTFSIDASGNWTYTMNSAHTEFAYGIDYTDSITVTSFDGSANQVITVTMTGSNDTPSITNSSELSHVTTAVGTSDAVYTVIGTDVDENANLTYSISGGVDASLFNIDSASGIVRFNEVPAVGVYLITVKVTDENDANNEKTVKIIVTSAAAANYTLVSESSVSNIESDSVIVGAITVAYLTTRASVQVPDGSTLTVASGDYSGTLTGNGSVVVTGNVDLTSANLENYTGNFTVSSGTLTIATDAGNMITLTNDSKLQISNTAAAIISTHMYASSNTIIENTNDEQEVTISGTVYKPSTNIEFVGLLRIVGEILGNTPDGSIVDAEKSDIYVGTVNQGASVTYTSAGTYTYDGATLIEADSTLTFENGGVNVPNSDFVVNGSLALDYASTCATISANTVKTLELKGTLDITISKVLTAGNTYTLLNYDSKTGSGITILSYSAANMNDVYVVGTFGDTSHTITVLQVLQLTSNSSTVIAGYTIQLTSNMPSSTYSSSNTSVATVDSSGVVTGVAAGTATITATNGTQTATKDITVTANSTGGSGDSGSTPSSNVCFPAKTPIMTNQGPVNIEDINPSVHTIRKKKIVAITKTVAHDKNLVRIAKHALGHLYPEKTTFISQNHKVFYQGQMVKAKNLVDEAKGVTFVPYNGEVLYNVLLEEHEKMQVNNLIVETLHPEHKVAKLYRFLQNVDVAHHGKLIALFNKCDRAQRLRR